MPDKIYIICPCFSDNVPFLVDSLEEAMNFVMTEEYYAIDKDTLERISEDGYRKALIMTPEDGDMEEPGLDANLGMENLPEEGTPL